MRFEYLRMELSRFAIYLFGVGFLAAICTSTSTQIRAADPETRFFEMRVVTANAGKFAALSQRFKDHAVKAFEKHGATTIGYFVPVDAKVEKIMYILAYKDLEARDLCIKNMEEDTAWKKLLTDSDKNGALAKDVKSTFLSATDYSPTVKTATEMKNPIFELRTYTSTKDNLIPLNNRFKNHTVKLFEKHGMTNYGYWYLHDTQPKSNTLAKENTLIYLLNHQSAEAAKKSFDAFRADPVWIKAKAESEKAAGGSLTVDKTGVVSEFFKVVDFSTKKK